MNSKPLCVSERRAPGLLLDNQQSLTAVPVETGEAISVLLDDGFWRAGRQPKEG